MKNNLITKILLICILLFSALIAYAVSEKDELEYLKLSTVDIGSFNEYRYKIVQNFFLLKEKFAIDGVIDEEIANNLLSAAEKGYNYLPENLKNENYYRALDIAIKKGLQYVDNEGAYNGILMAIGDFLDKTEIKKVTGTIEGFPEVGNAPLTVSLRGRVKDPTGSKIEDYNYVWWISEKGKAVVIGKKPSISYTIDKEGPFSVFLDVKSSHKNSQGYSDTLPLRVRKDIEVQEKVASLVIKVGATDLKQLDNIKFTPEDAIYGIILDATSSTPTNGSNFIKTSWNFGNGVKKEYSSGPKVERVIYNREGDYPVSLEMTTNELKKIKREFTISVHKPIATINSSQESGFLGDKFTFSAKPSGNEKNLNYSWKIIDIDSDKVLLEKSGNLITYAFNKKGKFNINLKVSDLSGNKDQYDIDSKIIYINSREPVANFTFSNPNKSKPNRYLLDATKSYDPDYLDDGKLIYSWLIDGEKVELEESNSYGSYGYYTFDTIGEHSVILQVVDPDSISSEKKGKIIINSILAVDFSAFPRVTQKDKSVNFIATSPEAIIYEWDFGDGEKTSGKSDKIGHVYKKSGTYDVKLTVNDKNNLKNTFNKNVYISESDSIMAFVDVTSAGNIIYEKGECSELGADGAYVTDRVSNIKFSGAESVNVDGNTTGLSYSWKVNNTKYFTSNNFNYKFDELGCFPVKLSISSDDGKSDSKTVWIKVKNLKPTISSLSMNVVNLESDPVVVNIYAVGAKDLDGGIQTYLWYYYTDTDPEPQDFRGTKLPNTTFVLPKITGNYYFVAVMKDNNEERISSEEISSSKYFITLAGDNLNTPIINLKVNNSSVAIGDEIAFTSEVENILGQNISNKVTYSWDFDGDGFYDKEGITGNIVHKYEKPGEFHAKLKVKNKGLSNVKTVTINVSNKLNADFDYVSIGNKIIFLNKSTGDYDKIKWDLTDSDTSNKKENFEYTYKDNSNSHEVTLKISKGDKVSSISKKVISNMKNILKARKDGLNLFSYPTLNTDNKIVLEKQGDEAYIYLGESKGTHKYFVIDSDTSVDSDLNGGKDDDEDNKGTNSYTTGEIYKIPLNDFKNQKVKVYLKDEKMTLVDSKEFEIVKNYIKESDLTPDTITLTGANEQSKQKFEKLKTLIKGLSKDHQSKAMEYMEKLKYNWSDKTEKTKTIIEFEAFLANTSEKSADEIYTLLESFIVDTCELSQNGCIKKVAYEALVTLILQDIKCSNLPKESPTCYSYMTDLLEKIYNSNDIEQNKKYAKIILETIKNDGTMTPKDSLDFKAILNTLVYGNNDTIPEEVKKVITDDKSSASSTSSFLSILKTIGYWFMIGILVIIGIIFIFFIYYKISNKDNDISFQDFIINKTSGGGNSDYKPSNEKIDILGDIFMEPKKDTPITTDVLGNSEVKNIVSDTPKKEEIAGIPSWLKGSTLESKVEEKTPTSLEKKDEQIPTKQFSEDKKETIEKSGKNDTKLETIEEKKLDSKTDVSEIKKETSKIPDWLSGSNIDTKTDTKKTTELPSWLTPKKDEVEKVKVEEPKIEEKVINPEIEEIKKEEKIEKPKVEEKVMDKKDTNELPDWLKFNKKDSESLPNEKTKVEEKTDTKKEEVAKTNKTHNGQKSNNEDSKNLTIEKPKVEEKAEIPKVEESKIEEKVTDKKDTNELPDWLKFNKKDSEISPTEKTKVEEKTDTKKTEEVKTNKTKKNVSNNVTTPDSDKEDLWNDGMKVPDWLKTTDDKK